MSDSVNQEFRKRLTIKALLYNCLGTTFPFFLMIILLPISGKFCEIKNPILKGDLFLYSAAIWATCLYFAQEYKNKGKKLVEILGNLSWLFIALSAGAYFYLLFEKDISIVYILIVSIILLVLSIYTLYNYLTISNKEKTATIDVQAESKEDIEKLKEQMS